MTGYAAVRNSYHGLSEEFYFGNMQMQFLPVLYLEEKTFIEARFLVTSICPAISSRDAPDTDFAGYPAFRISG
jgi:hypothetical protein